MYDMCEAQPRRKKEGRIGKEKERGKGKKEIDCHKNKSPSVRLSFRGVFILSRQ